MSRINPVDPKSATAKTKKLLDKVESNLGMTPNLIKTLANSPAALEAYLQFTDALSHGVLPAKLREQIALAVSESNHCDYCLAAHSAVGKMVGLSDEDVQDSRRGESPDSKTDAVLQFSKKIVERFGLVDDEDVQRLRDSGYSDAELAEIVAHVARNIFTNYFNHVAGTPVDFPPAPVLVRK